MQLPVLMKPSGFLLSAVFLASAAFPVKAAEFFVSKSGNDASNGKSKQASFLTIQKGVDALQPGDILTIGRGEYFESVKREGLGNMDVQTVIRAELPGSVLLRGDTVLPSSAFKKVDGYRFVYSTPFDKPVFAVNEVDSLRVLPTNPINEELEYSPGTSNYDAERKQLYLSTSDLQQPDTHAFSVSVVSGSGLLLNYARRVTVDGIAAAGFQNRAGEDGVKGIFLQNARGCIIRNCVAFRNTTGIAVDSAVKSKDGIENGWNLIEKCIAYGNKSLNIVSYASNHTEIRDCYTYRSDGYGIRHYGAGIRGPALLKNNISWGNSVDMMIKGGQADKTGLSENSITLGYLHSANVKNSVIGSSNQYNQKPGRDNLTSVFSPFGNQRMNALTRQRMFADPDNFDFRLQGSSTYRGTGPDKTDRGAYPYKANIFYVSPEGNDTNDGLSFGKKAWKTLAHAMGRLRPGDTLYLEGGTYDAAPALKVAGADGQITSIRGRGVDPVVIRGDIQIGQSRGLEFERLNFAGALTLRDGQDIHFNNCRFSAPGTPLQAASVQNLKVTHCEFTGFKQAAIGMEKSNGAWLSGNLYDNSNAPAVSLDQRDAVLYSDYNGYANAETAWRVASAVLKFAALQEQQDQYSVVRTPQYTLEGGRPVLRNANAFDNGGPHGTAIGFYRPNDPVLMRATAPELHSVSDTTANIQWWTSVPAETEVAWGETPGTPNKKIFNPGATSVTEGFSNLSLSGLKPGTKYYLRLVATKPLDADTAQYIGAAKLNEPVLTFQTAPAPSAPRMLYVAPNGDDKNTGLSRDQAWRTVSHAADLARPGDTVLIGGGTYVETVRLRATGAEGKPITFKAAPGEKVNFSGNARSINNAFSIIDKQYIGLDGFYFKDFSGGGWKSLVDIRFSDHVQVTRCFFNGYGKRGVGTQIRAQASKDVTIRNCVITRGFQGMVSQLDSVLLIENNVFLNNLIAPIVSGTSAPKTLVARNNIFVDSIPSKVQVLLFELGGFERYVFDNNAFYLRIPDAERKPFLFYGTGPGRTTIAEYDQKVGTKNLIVDNPQFKITQGVVAKKRTGELIPFLGDWIPRDELDFPDLFTVKPELIAAKIGLQPEAFQDFHFNKKATKVAHALN